MPSRSRSPAPRRSSRSPAPKKKAAPKKKQGSPIDDVNVQSAIAVVTLVVLQFVASGSLPTNPKTFLGDLLSANAADFNIAYWPWGVILTLHVLNRAQSANSGFWAGSFLQTVFSAFGAVFVSDFMNGRALSVLSDEKTLSLVFVLWYVCNRDIPFTGINLWKTVSGSGKCTQTLLDLATLTFNTGLIVNAAKTSAAAGPIGFAVFTPCVMAVAASSYDELWPLNKGIKFSSCSKATYTGLTIAIYTIAMPQLVARVPIVGNVEGVVDGFLGGNLILGVATLNLLLGHLVDVDVVDLIASNANKVLGL